MLDIARSAAVDRRLVSFVDPRSFEAEQYRRLRHQVEEIGTTRPLRVIAVTSPLGSEGKTLTALNLAGALAQRPSVKVLVIDADLRHPSVAAQLGLQSVGGGIAEALRTPQGRLEEFVEPVVDLNLTLLPCASDLEDAYELLTSPRFAELLASARTLYDYVIVDTPPVIPVPDSALIKSLVDGYIVVVSADSTPRKLVGEALSQLGPESVVGLVLNRDKRSLLSDYGTYYDSYFRSSRPLPFDGEETPSRAYSAPHRALDRFPGRVPLASPGETATSSDGPKTRWHERRIILATAGAIGIALAAVIGFVGIQLAGRPVPAAGPPSAAGTITLTSEPAGARVTIDSVDRGVTPLKVAVPAGQHAVEMEIAGSKRSLPLSIDAGGVVAQHIEFAAPIAQSGGLEVVTDPPRARVAIDGTSAGVTPLSVPALAAGEHKLTISGDGATVQRSVTIAAGSTATVMVTMAAASPSSGWAHIASPIELQVFEGGQLIGTTQASRLMLPVGWHDLEVVNTTLEFRSPLRLQIESGKTSSTTVTLPNGTVSVNAVPWAEVTIDGRSVGTTPLGNLALTIGPHELVLQHPQLGERKQTVTVTAGTPLRLAVDLTK